MRKRALLIWAVLSFAFGCLFGLSLSKWVGGYLNSGNKAKPGYLNEQKVLTDNAQEAVKSVARELLKNRVEKVDTLNIKLFSKWLIEFYSDAGMSDAKTYAGYIQSVDPVDYADIIGVVLMTSDTSRVFVD